MSDASVDQNGVFPFLRHDIDTYKGGYQVAAADVTGNGRPDIVALSTSGDRVDWYENPSWKKRPIARTPRNIDLACCDIDSDGQLEIALASGFHFSDSTRGGEIHLLRRTEDLEKPWSKQLIAVDPVTHRLRWGDLDGDGRKELVHVPIFGPGSDATRDPKPSHLWAFRIPSDPFNGPLIPWKIDETLTVLHGILLVDFDEDMKDEILTASFEGICLFDFDGKQWNRTHISHGAPPISDRPGAARGTSEVALVERPSRFLVAVEPWHGHQLVLYTPPKGDGLWRRRVMDETLSEGHALAVADFDGDGLDEIVVGWRGEDGGLALFDPDDARYETFARYELDRGIAVEGLCVADFTGNGKPDLAAIAGRTQNLVWYENLCTS